MKTVKTLFDNNRQWAAKITQSNPLFFQQLARQQSPKYLWIGCADSRVPANEIVGLLPGELFVHRNVANLVIHTDMNCLSVLQYAVDVLKVRHVIVCGHYGCGGIKAAVEERRHGLIDNWLRHIRDLYQRNRAGLDKAGNRAAMIHRLCELNVKEQVINASNTTIVQDAWRRRQDLSIHGWIYDIHDGLLKDLAVTVGLKR
ncbi:MAG: carbonate dehydratase [Lentisphaerae bacterium]|nr:carbonate dehydratase [Lentisphaerota bacterium]